MDALSMATSPGPLPHSDSVTIVERELRPASRIKVALAALSEAYQYAHDLATTPWEFALELSNLRRLNLTNSDLRWLVGRGYLEHGVEVTVRGEAERSFQHPDGLTFTKRTCFVLTPSGEEWFREQVRYGQLPSAITEPPAAADRSAPAPPLSIATPPGPHWDRNRQELRVGTTVVRSFKIPAPREETILAAFQESAWVSHIDDPLSTEREPDRKFRLQQTVASLNRQQRPPLIRFSTDATATGVLWEYLREPAAG